jgi:hypothetical protein
VGAYRGVWAGGGGGEGVVEDDEAEFGGEGSEIGGGRLWWWWWCGFGLFGWREGVRHAVYHSVALARFIGRES